MIVVRQDIPARQALCDLVVSVAEENSELQAGGITPEQKKDGSYVTSVDRNLQETLLSKLSDRWPL